VSVRESGSVRYLGQGMSIGVTRTPLWCKSTFHFILFNQEKWRWDTRRLTW